MNNKGLKMAEKNVLKYTTNLQANFAQNFENKLIFDLNNSVCFC